MRLLNDKMPVRTFVESEAEPGAWTELELLREAFAKGLETRYESTSDRGTVSVNVNQTLQNVESVEASIPRDNPLPLFICYARANERLIQQLKPSMTVLARRGYIAPWRDSDLVPGEDWDDTIKERLSRSIIILFMVSRQFLASHYITFEERPLAMRLLQERKAWVVPVLLSRCSWRDEDFAKLEKLPYKDTPVSSYNPREDAWAKIEEGLKKVVTLRTILPNQANLTDSPS